MKKFSFSYIIIPLIVLGVALLGQYFTGQGMEWYATLGLPRFTPSGVFIGIVWTIIFVLSALSAILFWSSPEHDKKFGIVISVFIDNAILNVLWTWLFFVKHWILGSIIEMIILWSITIILIVAIWPRSKWSAVLLIPYAIWLVMATYLAIGIYIIN